MDTRIILLNGPPRSGKDTAARHLQARFPWIRRASFADELKRRTHLAYGLGDIDPLAFEAVKDEPRDEFYGATPRQAYIAFSERLMKPLHGPTIFGRLLLARVEAQGAGDYVAPDSGFAAEAAPFLVRLGAPRVLLIQIDADERGCSFAGDSRSYIDLPGVETHRIANPVAGDATPFLASVEEVVERWLCGRPRIAA